MCTISKDCVLKYKKSCANVVTVWMYFWNALSRNVLQYYAIVGCDATSFFCINGKINPFKEALKNQVI